MKYKAIAFDLDGTLIDTLKDLQGSVNAALAGLSMPPRTLDEVRTRVGNGMYKLVERSAPEHTPDETVQSAYSAFRAHYAKHYMDNSAPYDGILPLLRELKARGIKAAVVSNKADSMTKRLCDNWFGDLVDAVFGESETMPKKPDPQMVFAALDALGVTADETLYVGDSEVDCKTAQSTGLRFIAVLWGFRTEENLRAAGAAEFISVPDGLLRYLDA